MRTSPPERQQPTRPETSGAGAVTVLVLLLLVGGMDCRSAAAFGRVVTGLVHEEVVESAPRVGAVARTRPDVEVPSVMRDTSRGERPAMTVSDAMLPAPRAPDRDQVV